MFEKYLAIIVLGLLIQLVGIGWCQLQSPCSNVFQYVRDETTGIVEGYVEIHRVPIGVAAHIKMSLSIAASLPTKYVGKLELAVSREQAIAEIEQGRPLVYHVRFPIQRPVPLVTAIIFNKLEYCSGKRAVGSIVTSITLEHTLFPPGVVPQMQDPSNEVSTPFVNQNQSPNGRPIPALETNTRRPIPAPAPSMTYRPFTEPSKAPVPTKKFNWNLVPIPTSTPLSLPNEDSASETRPYSSSNANDTPQPGSLDYRNCGRPKKSEVNFLISKGEKTEPGDWPWLVAIFVQRIQLEFQCAGSLLTDRHVLTAAHCMKTHRGQEVPASTLLAVVGRYKLRGWAEKGSVTAEVLDYKVHTEYRHDTNSYNHDIAIMTLMETVTFGRLIMPICLWSGPRDVESVVGKTGFVIGWGRDELGNLVTEEPRSARVPIVSQEVCLRSHTDFVRVTSNQTFCGGSQDGSGPCNGDSGSGLVLYDEENRRYHIRGVVSLSLQDRTTGSCDLTQFVVFTDVAKYIDWIEQQVAS